MVQLENILPLQKFRRFIFSADILTKIFPSLVKTATALSSEGYISRKFDFKFVCSNFCFSDSFSSSILGYDPLAGVVC
jgi:hypothetical protein